MFRQDGGQAQDHNSGSWTKAEEKQLLLKLDLLLLPTLWMMSLISHLDRSSIGNARIAGMGSDLQLTSSQYISYIPLSPLFSMTVTRTRPSILLPCTMACWGIVTCAQAAARTSGQLLALRVLLGMFESALTPTSIMLLSSWYRPAEQAKRAITYTSSTMLGGAFGGLLAGGIIERLEGSKGIRGWQWLFIVEGVITIVWAIICVFLIPDFPENSRLVKGRQKEICIMRMKEVGTAGYAGKLPGGKKMGKIRSVVVACSDWRTWLITSATTALSCSFVLPYFYPGLVYGLGYKNPVTAQYMTVPIWVAAFVWSIGICILADRMSPKLSLLLSLSITYALVLTIAVCAVYGTLQRYILFVFMATAIFSTIPLGAAFAASTLRDMPPEARAVAVGLTGIGAQLGNIYGAYLFPVEAAPKYLVGFGVMAGTQGVAAVLFLIAFILLRRRDMKGVTSGKIL
ncbi:major facilitator superfamily domain-containing protein [Cercophora newfieldiana]|uniref:Major facilitator superfamily domain-containing protein n=1 Tax=Cercophora newfieldiana TaxID=92897 RepID=A0AA39YJP8_9PEZI|nr:major facilitator superfamily domain-containing protein [Cercophora newfieldiana]